MNLFFCLVMEYHPKKMTETASLRVVHDAKFRHFFSGDSSITKQNK
jgi:hypothetical protein